MSREELLQMEDDRAGLFRFEPGCEADGIRLADMIRFKDAYTEPITFALPPDGPVSFAETSAGRAGLVFYDSSHLTEKKLAYLPQNGAEDSLWFVFVI